MALYPWLESVLEEQYRPVCRLRKTERNEIVLLEQKERHVRIVKRIFAGGSDVYRKLLTLKHKNMPEILEVTEFGDRTLVLEEYIDGVTFNAGRGILHGKGSQKPYVRALRCSRHAPCTEYRASGYQAAKYYDREQYAYAETDRFRFCPAYKTLLSQ